MTAIDHRLYLFGSILVFGIGFYSLLVQDHPLRRIMSLNVMGTGVFLFLVTLGIHTPGPIPDPVPQAMVLTGIVVSVCATALGLVLADRLQKTSDPRTLEGPDRGPARSIGKTSGGTAEPAEDPAS